MTLVKNSAGGYEINIEDRSIGRLHLSLRTTVKKDAMPRHDAIEALVRDGQIDLVDLLRHRKLRVEAVETCRRQGRSWDTLRRVVHPWPSVADGANEYVDWLTANPKKNGATAPTAKAQLSAFVAFERPPENGDAPTAMGELRLDDVTTEDLTAYQTALFGLKRAPNTVRAYVARVGSLYRWAQRREQQRAKAERRPYRVLEVPIDPEVQATARTARDRFLSADEATFLLAATPDELLCPVLIGLLAGFRVSEVLHLRPVLDVDLDVGLLIVQAKQVGSVKWRPKTGNRREVPIAADLLPVLRRHLERYASSTWLVPSLLNPERPFSVRAFHDHFTEIVRDAGLVTGRTLAAGVTFHTLRHTFASWLVMRSVDLYAVAKLLGNTVKMVETTYGHLAPEHRRRAIASLCGLLAIPTPPPASEAEASRVGTASRTELSTEAHVSP